MSRPVRIEYPEAWYHVTCRGNERGIIFRDDRDRERFLKVLEESVESFNVEVHCYVMMSNHFHFLLKTLEGNLGRFMQRFNTAYATYYNLRHNRSGHLYQGRYKAILVEADAYLLELSRYIHLNPVMLKKLSNVSFEEKAAILKEAGWSSFRGYTSLRSRSDVMHYEEILGYMGGDNKKGRERYSDFVMQGLAGKIENPLEDTKADAILGTESFVTWVKESFLDIKEIRNKDYPNIKKLEMSAEVEEIAEVVGAEYGIDPDDILRVRSRCREARQVLIEECYRLNFKKKSLQELGQELGGIGGDAIAHAHKRMQLKMEKDKNISQRVERIHGLLVNSRGLTLTHKRLD